MFNAIFNISVYYFIADPGVLLFSLGTNVSYYRISESSLTPAQLQGNEKPLISSEANILGIVKYFNY